MIARIARIDRNETAMISPMPAGTRTVALVSPLGGTGQTTVAANLACILAQREVPGLVLDLCAQNALGLHLGQTRPVKHGWVQLVDTGRWWGDAALQNSARVRWLPFGVSDVALRARLHDCLRNQDDWLQQQLAALSLEQDSLILLDVPTWPCALAQQALRCADLVLVVLETSWRAQHIHAEVQSLLQQARASAVYSVLFTRFDPRRVTQQTALHALQTQWHGHVLPHVVHEDESVPGAMVHADCVARHTPHAQAAHDLQGVANWLHDHLRTTSGAPGRKSV